MCVIIFVKVDYSIMISSESKRKKGPLGKVGSTAVFLKEFLRSPGTIGAIAPSSRSLGDKMIAMAQFDDSSVIVEYGPGTGVFTRRIMEFKPRNAEFIAIEYNEMLSGILKSRFPGVDIVSDSAENIQRILENRGRSRACTIISSLPWAVFDDEFQDRLLHKTYEILKPKGRFVTFAYLQGMLLPSGRNFRTKLYKTFNTVEISRVVWKNIPPAFVYSCQK